MEWKSYKLSESWKLLRDKALTRDAHRCKRCGRKTKLEMHHDKYPDVPENDCLENVEILCRECHQYIHDRKNKKCEKYGYMNISEIMRLVKRWGGNIPERYL